MGLRTKVFTGFILLAGVLVVAGAWSIYEMSRVGTALQRTLDEEHEGNRGTGMMIRALEREDAGALLLSLGRVEAGRDVLGPADSLFEAGYRTAQEACGSGSAGTRLAGIRSRYDAWRTLWADRGVRSAGGPGIDAHIEARRGAFADVMAALHDLHDEGDRGMYEAATALRDHSSRAIRPGIVAVAAALVFVLIFYLFLNFYVVGPVVTMHEAMQRFLGNDVPFDIEVETNDELGELARDVQCLCARIEPGGGER